MLLIIHIFWDEGITIFRNVGVHKSSQPSCFIFFSLYFRLLGISIYSELMEIYKIHNVKLHDLDSSDYIIRVIKSIRMRREIRNKYGRDERCIQVFGEKSGQFEDLGVNRDIIKMDIKYQVWQGLDSINLA